MPPVLAKRNAAAAAAAEKAAPLEAREQPDNDWEAEQANILAHLGDIPNSPDQICDSHNTEMSVNGGYFFDSDTMELVRVVLTSETRNGRDHPNFSTRLGFYSQLLSYLSMFWFLHYPFCASKRVL